MYLIGSRAAGHYLDREVKPDADWDFVSEVRTDKCREYEFSPLGDAHLAVCREYYDGEIVKTPHGEAKVVNPVGLMLIKRSHLHRPLNFAKHIRDYHKLHSLFGNQIDGRYKELLANLTKITKEKYGDRTPSLKKSKREFFDDYVTKYYEHDDIHYATCYYNEPIYEKLKPDPDMVWCSRKLWNDLAHDDKIRCVREEAYTIALERYIIPKMKTGETPPPAKFSFYWSLERICTTLTSGWFRDFAIDNWLEISQYDIDFVAKFERNIDGSQKRHLINESVGINDY